MVPIQCTSFVLWLVAAPMGFNTSTNQRMFKIIIHIFSYLNNYNCLSSFWQHLQTVNWALWSIFWALFFHFQKKKVPIWPLWSITKHVPQIIQACVPTPKQKTPKCRSPFSKRDFSCFRCIIHNYHYQLLIPYSCIS